MKKIIAILAFVILTMNATAQNIYATGYYLENDQKVAAVYKNGEILYTVHTNGLNSIPKVVLCDSEENVYWMVNLFNGNSFRYTEVWKNDQLYVTTENLAGVRIIDIYCSGDTLYYAGHYTNDDNVTVATVWNGTDFTTHWQLGDGTHNSFIYDAEMNPNTGTPYFCGYVTDDKTKATVWEKREILYSYNPSDNVISSVAEEISIDNDSVFTLGFCNLDTGFDTYSFSAVWKNGERVASFSAEDIVNCLCAYNGDFYYCWAWPHGMEYIVAKNASITTMLQFPMDGSAGANKIKAFSNDIYVLGINENKGCIWKNFEILLQPENCKEATDIFVFEEFPSEKSEWYYEIQNDNGSITYQHLECVGDTTVGNERPKIIVRSNTHYDRDGETEVTHEYVYEKNNIVYWWNKDSQEFTTLYDLNAEVGDEWEIKVGTESLTMHVDAVESLDYEGKTYRMLRVSDANDIFSGNIVCGIGHQTSFFPERLMNRGRDFRVEGLRCYWVEDALLYHNGDDDCDAIYDELHGVDENGPSAPSTGSGTTGTLSVYPNPANNVLFVQTLRATSLPTQTYRITNLMGQTLLQGCVTAETQQINIESLPEGIYFISVGDETLKFVKR